MAIRQALQAALALEHRATGVVDGLPRVAHVRADWRAVAFEQLAPFAGRGIDEILLVDTLLEPERDNAPLRLALISLSASAIFVFVY